MYILVDIDGTVADLSHRLPLIKGEKKNYDKFFMECYKDAPIQHVIDIVEALHNHNAYTIVFLSGRSEICREETEAWLEEYVWVKHAGVYMRPAGDTRADDVVKLELLDQVIADRHEEPAFVIDDRPRVIDAWRKRGLKVVRVGDWYEEERKDKCPQGRLYVMVGPSGAGKTHLIQNDDVLSKCFYVGSDDLRQRICGDWKDQTKNDLVFHAVHSLAREAIMHGMDTVVDATNIRTKDRKTVAKLANGGPVTYVVVDRPMEEKERDAGWRKDVPGLIERHYQTFKSNLKDILRGDGIPDVRVEVR